MIEKSSYKLFVDGVCLNHRGPGGWAALVSNKDHDLELSGCELMTTNHRMELLAVIRGLEIFTKPTHVTIHTGSYYVMKGATEWLAVWKRRCWKTSEHKPVKNTDLWKKFESVLGIHRVVWRYNSNDVRMDNMMLMARDAILKSKS